MKNKTVYITQGALIASLYVILTLISSFFGLANGVIQVRLSEALTILPIFVSSAIPGLFIGCIISNIITNCAIYDVIFGGFATLIGACGTHIIWKLCVKKYNRKLSKILASIPPIISNTLIVPWILSRVYNLEGSIIYFVVTVLIGEIISAGIGGQLLAKAIEPHKEQLGLK